MRRAVITHAGPDDGVLDHAQLEAVQLPLADYSSTPSLHANTSVDAADRAAFERSRATCFGP